MPISFRTEMSINKVFTILITGCDHDRIQPLPKTIYTHGIVEKNSSMKKLPSLNALRVFEVAARHSSLVQAAQELCVTQGAVSRQIRQLELSLGFDLFERRNRGIFLTSEGETLYSTCQEMLTILNTTLQRLDAGRHNRPLVMSCEPTIAMHWLIPRLPRFREQHPHIPLHLSAAGGPVDWRSGIDLALRRDDFTQDGHCEIIGQEYIGPVCAPIFASRFNTLTELPSLHTHTRPQAWHQWQQLSGTPQTSSEAHWFEHFYLSLQAAIAGIGVAISSLYMVESTLNSSHLLAPRGFIADGSAYQLLSAGPFDQDVRRITLLNWLREEFAQSAARYGLTPEA